MIVDFVMETALGFLRNGLDGILPSSGSLPFTVPSGLIYGYSWLNRFLPVAEVVQVGAVILGIYLVVFLVRLLVFLYDRIPGKFT